MSKLIEVKVALEGENQEEVLFSFSPWTGKDKFAFGAKLFKVDESEDYTSVLEVFCFKLVSCSKLKDLKFTPGYWNGYNKVGGIKAEEDVSSVVNELGYGLIANSVLQYLHNANLSDTEKKAS